MAAIEESTIASVKEEKLPKKKKIFGDQKAPDLIIYRLIKTNDVKMRDDTPLYPPYIRFPNYDIITWGDGTRAIRWLPGFQSIFVDEQEAGNRMIPTNILENPNNRFEIIDGEIKVPPHQKTKIQFLDLCNRNADSNHRTGSVAAIFARVSEAKTIEQKKAKQQLQKEALEKAFGADEEQIAFHAKYLNIMMIDPSTSASRTYDAVQTDYRQVAMDKPEEFLKTFDDEDLKLKYRIEKALSENFITLKVEPGKASYASNKLPICDVPQNTDLKYVIDALFMFTQTKNGGDFLKKVTEFGS